MNKNEKLILICKKISFDWGSIKCVYCEDEKVFKRFGLGKIQLVSEKDMIFNQGFIDKLFIFINNKINDKTIKYSEHLKILQDLNDGILTNLDDIVDYIFKFINKYE